MLGIDGLESCNHEGCKLNLMALMGGGSLIAK